MVDTFWLDFWTAALILSGAVFAGITLVVAVRGGAELLRMFRRPR
ncbi:MAG TPA: hypothetical protein VMV31_06035 [Terriglobales bacterium]|nr:hypothetical protein [Terriglobales bacterium]